MRSKKSSPLREIRIDPIIPNESVLIATARQLREVEVEAVNRKLPG